MKMPAITIAIPRMSKEPELTPAQIRYIDSLARAGAQFRWIDLDDPDEAVAEAMQYPGLTLAALSEDGFVEALEKQDASFCIGVQWHPERLSGSDPRQQAIFDKFVEACR